MFHWLLKSACRRKAQETWQSARVLRENTMKLAEHIFLEYCQLDCSFLWVGHTYPYVTSQALYLPIALRFVAVMDFRKRKYSDQYWEWGFCLRSHVYVHLSMSPDWTKSDYWQRSEMFNRLHGRHGVGSFSRTIKWPYIYTPLNGLWKTVDGFEAAHGFCLYNLGEDRRINTKRVVDQCFYGRFVVSIDWNFFLDGYNTKSRRSCACLI